MAAELDKIVERTFPSAQLRTFRTLVAVSGGPDSVALLRLIAANADTVSKSNLIVAHINHGTRAKQSDADAAFVSASCLTEPIGILFRNSLVRTFRGQR